MQMDAFPSSPRRLNSGTTTSSNTSSAVPEARIPNLCLICWPRENPGIPFSTMKEEILPSTLAYTRKASPSSTCEDKEYDEPPFTAPLVIHIFLPFSTYSFPLRTAVVRIPRTSVPPSGSVMHTPPIELPSHIWGRKRLRCSSFALMNTLLTYRTEWAR